jgi:hypothetical protein
VARKERIDRVLSQQMADVERRIFLVKLAYEKYFSGLEPIEPLKEREALQRTMRELSRKPMNSTRERHRWQSLRSRMSSMEQYWQRNLIMIERGTHPKMKFRADLKTQQGGARAPSMNEHLASQREVREKAQQDESNLRQVYDAFVQARKKCGQSEEVNYRAVRQVLRNQAKSIRSRYRCDDVEFKVSVEKGKAKVKAVPRR